MDPIKFKSRIISALRKLTYSWQPRKNVSEKAKRAPATFECEKCGKWCYTGKSESSLRTLQARFPDKNVTMERIDIDHINPIIPVDKGFTDWNDLINGMFCSEDNLMALCKTCHDIKTKDEKMQRKVHKEKKK